MEKILVIDDEKAIADIIKFNLEKEGYIVATAYDGEEGVQAVEKFLPDLVILDIMMPKKDGFQVLKEIRMKYKFPVIMLTAKEEEVDKVLGLELGADDYITKPFSMRELTARVKANLRRQAADNAGIKNSKVIKCGDLTIDVERYEVRKGDEIIELTLREFELVKFLATHAGQIFSREALLEKVWGYEYYGDVRTVDVTVRRVREKLENDVCGGNYEYLLTKRGVGYYFNKFE